MPSTISFKFPSLLGRPVAPVGEAATAPNERNLLLGELNSIDQLDDELRFEHTGGLPVACRASVPRVRYAYSHTLAWRHSQMGPGGLRKEGLSISPHTLPCQGERASTDLFAHCVCIQITCVKLGGIALVCAVSASYAPSNDIAISKALSCAICAIASFHYCMFPSLPATCPLAHFPSTPATPRH